MKLGIFKSAGNGISRTGLKYRVGYGFCYAYLYKKSIIVYF
jgi:hypothetical protein